MVFCKRVFSSIYRERNRFKTLYLDLICSEKDLENPEKVCQKAVWKTDFRIAQKRKEPVGCCRLGGRPGRSTASSAGKEPLAPVDRHKRQHNSLLAVDRTGRPRKTESKCIQSVDLAVDRQTCTSWHWRRSTGPVGRSA